MESKNCFNFILDVWRKKTQTLQPELTGFVVKLEIKTTPQLNFPTTDTILSGKYIRNFSKFLYFLKSILIVGSNNPDTVGHLFKNMVLNLPFLYLLLREFGIYPSVWLVKAYDNSRRMHPNDFKYFNHSLSLMMAYVGLLLLVLYPQIVISMKFISDDN